MSRLEELIAELCPEGVEYRNFTTIASYVRGVTYNKSKEVKNDDSGYKLLRANNIELTTNTLCFSDVKVIDYSTKVKQDQFLRKNDILICAGSGSKEHIGKVAFIDKDLDYTFGGFMGVIRVNSDILLPRYLFHVLTGEIFKSYLLRVSNSSTINKIGRAHV